MVVVANRLPFDLETLPDGSTKARQAPGGLVTALAPILSRRQGAWIGWPGTPDVTLEPTTTDGLSLFPVTLAADDVKGFYEGFSNATLWPLYHDAVADSQFHRVWWESYQRVNAKFAEAAAERRRARRDRLGARLPAATRAAAAAPAPAGRADRVLPAHPVPAGRAVHAAAVAQPDRQRPARRRPDRFPAARRRAELRPAGQVADRGQHHRRHHRARRPDHPRRGLPDLDRLVRAVGAGRHPRGARRGPADPRRPRPAPQDHPRRRPARLHQGHRRPAAGLRGIAGREGPGGRGHRDDPDRHPQPGTARVVHARCGSRSSGRSAR